MLDQTIFEFINGDLSNGFLDTIMPIWRSKITWIPLYVFFGILIIFQYKKHCWYAAIAIALTIGITDQLSSELIKKNVQRPRPCHVLSVERQEINLLVDCGSGYSFPSSHAANHFALATILWLVFRRRWRKVWIPVALYLWAFSIGFGQIYVGVHYPFDVLGGGALGCAVGGGLGWALYRVLKTRLFLQ